jgi:hypothetical protein
MWHQRARIRWAQLGDRNTKFFHASATERWRRNLIVKLQREDGTWTDNEQQTRSLLVRYYKSLYRNQTEDTVVQELYHQHNLEMPSITVEEGERLLIPPTAVEIHRTLCQMGMDRAPGPDGITLRFLKQE